MQPSTNGLTPEQINAPHGAVLPARKPGQKLNVEYVDLKEEVGSELVGKFLARTTRDWTDRKTGETKPLSTLVFEQPDGARVALFEDAGLRNVMEQSLIVPGDSVKIVYLGKADLTGGRTVNQYDIFSV